MRKISYVIASYNNPKGNADTERVMRTIKVDLVWPNDFESPFDLQPALDKWINDYNTDSLHSSIGYKTPCIFEHIELSEIPSALIKGVCVLESQHLRHFYSFLNFFKQVYLCCINLCVAKQNPVSKPVSKCTYIQCTSTLQSINSQSTFT